MSNRKEKPETRTVNLADILVDERFSVREEHDTDAIADYAEGYRRGDKFPEIVCVEIGKKLYLVAGGHRLPAMRRAGIETAEVVVLRNVSPLDAILFAAKDNAKNAVRMTREDKRKAIRQILLTEGGAEMSDRAIAKELGVGHPLVADIRRELVSEGRLEEYSSRRGSDGREINVENIGRKAGSQIGKVTERKGADGKTYPVASGEIPQSEKRTADDGDLWHDPETGETTNTKPDNWKKPEPEKRYSATERLRDAAYATAGHIEEIKNDYDNDLANVPQSEDWDPNRADFILGLFDALSRDCGRWSAKLKKGMKQ